MTDSVLVEAEKVCSLCGVRKALSEFHRNRHRRDGHNGRCKDCAVAVARDWYRENSTHAAFKESRERQRALTDPALMHAYHHKSKLRNYYKLTPQQYAEMLERQNGGCAICGTTDPGAGRRTFCVDHDHRCCPGNRSCGLCVRGLLCAKCNDGLGRFGDDIGRLKSAIRFLGGEV